MTIRRKLLLLLLAIALTPLVVTFVMRQVSFRLARRHLAAKTREALDSDARSALQQLLENYGEVFKREKRLIDSLVRRQVREAEIRLARESAIFALDGQPEPYGFQAQLQELPDLRHEYFDDAVGKDGKPLKISHRQQGYFLAKGINKTDVAADLARLWTMTEVYHEVRRLAPKTILWQYTTLENGLHTNYPAGGELPDQQTYDPRKRLWYENTRLNNDIVRVGPIVDAATGQAIVTIAAPVRHPDGSFAGVTAIDRTITDVLANMKLPAGWAGRAEKMLVTLTPKADPCQVELMILLQSSYTRTDTNWQREIQLEQLQSDDSDRFRKMINDIRAGKPGVQNMPYKGTPSLWAYGRSEYTQTVPVLIIPYEIVIELADSMEEFLLGQSAQWRVLTGIILLVAFGAAIVLGVVRARSLTKPIAELTEAGRRLAAGDFDTRVDITTGDELQQLGEVFNQTGPKLREREKMKRSLELAKAIQQNLLPAEAPKLKNFEVAGLCTYCDETGGDYYDFIDLIQTGPGTMGIALGDVSGHGIGAALLMATARSMLRINAKYYGTDLARLFVELNRQLVSDTDDDKFMTLFYGVLDDDSRSLVWVSGGHDPALWYHKAGGDIEELPNTGMLMGLTEDAGYDQAGPVRLEKGDLIVIGTDGIWETQNIDDEAFGKQRFLEIIRAASNRKAQDICLEVTESVMRFRGSAEQTDDITLVVAKAV